MEINKVYAKMFLWLGVGLLITFLTGYIVSENQNMLEFMFKGSTWMICAIIEVVLVIFLSARIMKMSPTTANICFILYSFVTGLTFSSIFVTYEISSIIYVFGITSFLFIVFALIGTFINVDLTKIGTYLFMILLGIVICFIINIFIGSEAFNIGLVIASVVIFVIYIAYDINKVKYMLNSFPSEDNLAIFGALQLYLDFINIFIDLLRLFGKSEN